MLKKIIPVFLLAIILFCGINLGTTTAMAAEDNTSSVEVPESADLKMASISPYDLYPDGCDANVPLKIMEGDAEICTITFDLALVDDRADSYTSLKMQKNSIMKIVPNESFSIKKIIVQGHNSSNLSVTMDASQGTKIDYKNLTDDEKTLLGNPSNALSVATFEINGDYVATEENPYAMKAGMNFYLKTIHVVYERLSYSATVYPKKGSYDSLDAGHFNVGLAHIGYNDSTGVMIMTGSTIVITHAPGYVIKSVILKTTYNISLMGEPEFTYEKTEEDAWTLTNFPISSSYVINNNSSQGYFLSSITINYKEHIHDEVYTPSYDDTYHFNQCGCFLRTDEEEHDFNEPTVTQPTYNSKGESKATCKICNYEKVEELLPNIADAEVRLVNELVYSGGQTQTQQVEVTYGGNVVDPANYKITGNSKFNAGDYTLKITGQGVFTGVINVPFTIKKAVVEKPVADDTVFTYNGQPQTYNLQASNLYTISNATQTNAGPYTVSVAINNTSNVQWADGTTDKLSFSFVINKATYDMSGVVFADKTVTYNGNTYSLAIEGTLPDSVSVFYENNDKTDAGEYTVTANFVSDDPNYNAIANKTATLTIEKATYDMSGVVFANKTIVYNGTAFSIEATNLPDGVTVAYENNAQTNAGEYVVTAIFTGNANYNAIANKTATLTIEKVVVSAPTADSTAFTYNGQAQTYTLQTNSLYTISNTTYTNAGTYPITVELNDATNYQWADGTVANLEYSFVINRASVNKPTADGTVFTYNGQAQTYTLQTNSLYTISNTTYTNAGTYPITVELNDATNYQWADGTVANLEYSFVINRASVNKPTADGTVFTYNGQAQTYSVASNPLYTISCNVKTNAGSYSVVISIKDKVNYQWSDGTTANLNYTFVINKATYDMSGISFNNLTVKYNDSEHKIEIKGTLPAGVTVSYENNVGLNAGIYQAVAKFTGDADNYNLISDMTATLTINKDTHAYINPETNKEDVIISSENGIDPTKELVVELIEKQASEESFVEFLERRQKVAAAYDVKLLLDGASVQPDGSLKFKVLIPSELKDKEFSIMHIHNGSEKSMLDYVIEGDFAVFETDKLSEFVLVYEMGSLTWLIIVLTIIAVLEVCLLAFLISKKKHCKAVKLNAAYPPFIFGMFLPLSQLVVVIILAVVLVALTTTNVIFACELLGSKKDLSFDTNLDQSPNLDDGDDGEEDLVVTEDEPTTKNLGFEYRLNSSSNEIKGYYETIKNELLSYKKVKSRLSFKHETFKIGKELIAKLMFRGKTLCLYLALNPQDYEGTKYKVEDMSKISKSKSLPTMYRINLPRRSVYALDLISDLTYKFNAIKIETE